MKPLNETDIRRSIVNASKGEIQRMPLPGLHEVLWAAGVPRLAGSRGASARVSRALGG